MWKFWNKLFGWDYLYWRNSADSGVARIHKGHDGNGWYFRYKLTKVVDSIDDPFVYQLGLTCSLNKYRKIPK